VDRLSIHQLKEVFDAAHKERYRRDMEAIRHDIDLLLKERKDMVDAEFVHAVIVVAQMNAHIWYNEAKARRGEEQDLRLLSLTHGLNGLRNRAGNIIAEKMGEGDRKDVKVDCLAADFKDWEIALLER
jgi:hypothetical protein